ncbi:hypothetical protein KC19_12G044400 [Ceratodon purpureus]|uniref:Uncharacterized protein n=1 Tax=Ceratodon purpureus TaxID=3225 RepID=A0A8T0G3Q1_CERPU|nr:hypothetical protein KC19_12G044400 [Ceratodon purpureus]
MADPSGTVPNSNSPLKCHIIHLTQLTSLFIHSLIHHLTTAQNSITLTSNQSNTLHLPATTNATNKTPRKTSTNNRNAPPHSTSLIKHIHSTITRMAIQLIPPQYHQEHKTPQTPTNS